MVIGDENEGLCGRQNENCVLKRKKKKKQDPVISSEAYAVHRQKGIFNLK